MRPHILFLFGLLFSCKEEIELPDNLVVCQWDLRDRYDSIPGMDNYYFPKAVIFKNNKIFVFRHENVKPTIDFDDKTFEFGELRGKIPNHIINQINKINPTQLDTFYPYKGGYQYCDIHYGVIDLKNDKYCLFIPLDINKSTFSAINDVLKYTDTVKIEKSSDSTELNTIRQRIYKTAESRSPKEEIRHN